MISVLILDGFADGSLCNDAESVAAVKDVYIPLMTAILRYNGIVCKTVHFENFGNSHYIIGADRNSIIYAPKFSCSERATESVSFIYTDSSSSASVSFSVASRLRNIRERDSKIAVFVNELKSYDSLKKFSPIIVDDMRFFKTTAICDMTESICKGATSATMAIAEHFGVIFKPLTYD